MTLARRQRVDSIERAADLGCSGLMVLPPYVYQGDWREMKAHVSAIIGATVLAVTYAWTDERFSADEIPAILLALLGAWQVGTVANSPVTDRTEIVR